MPCAGSSNAEVQCGQRTAARGISVQQNGQGLVVGAASSFLRPTANRDRKSTRQNSSHNTTSRMPSSA